MRFVLVLALLIWTPPAAGLEGRWEALIDSGKAYWESVGTPEFPPIVRLRRNPCVPGVGCAIAVNPPTKRVPCQVWLHRFANEVVAAHEVGHCLGFPHMDYGGVMSEIPPSHRKADRALCRRDWRC